MSLHVLVVGALPSDLSKLGLTAGEPVVILVGSKEDVREAGTLLYQDVSLVRTPHPPEPRDGSRPPARS